MRPKKTILCVDDNEQILSVRTYLLTTRGYRVVCLQSAREALDYIEQSVPGNIDLLLCDLLMPQMDGNELVRRDRKSTRLNSSHMSISYAVFCLQKKKH